MQTHSLMLRFTGGVFGKRALCREREATSSSLSVRQQHGRALVYPLLVNDLSRAIIKHSTSDSAALP